MAKVMVIGDVADILLIVDDEDDQVVATCHVHHLAPYVDRAGCGWTERYDDMRDATEYAADHADGARQE
jgi:hypothetical protein